jgi:hypothetical protein
MPCSATGWKLHRQLWQSNDTLRGGTKAHAEGDILPSADVLTDHESDFPHDLSLQIATETGHYDFKSHFCRPLKDVLLNFAGQDCQICVK